jgi:hypothetical protein
MKEAEEDAVTRIECGSKKEKIKHVSCINVEVKDLQLSYSFQESYAYAANNKKFDKATILNDINTDQY